MKVVVFSAYSLPHVGGMEVYDESLIAYLIKLGCDVDLLTTQSNLPSWQFINERLPIPKKLFGLSKHLKGCELLIINCHFYLHSVILAYLAKRLRIRCVVICLTGNYLKADSFLMNIAVRIYEKILIYCMKNLCKEFIAISEASNSFLSSVGIKTNLTIPYYPIIEDLHETTENLPCKNDYNIRRKLNISDDKMVFCFVGRLISTKGVDVLIKAFKRLKNENVCLVIAGAGILEEYIKNNISENIFFLGSLKHEDVGVVYSASDCFCLLSKCDEGCAIALFEAIVEGTYCFVSTGGGSGRKLNENYSTIINDVTEDTVYAGLEEVISRRQELKSLAKQQRIELFKKQLSMEDALAKLLSKK